MTQEISKNVKTHVILTFQKNKHFISQAVNEQLQKLSNNDMIKLDDGRMLRLSTVAEILPIEEYYKNHPDERPQYNNYTNPKLEKVEPMTSWSKRKQIRIYESCLKGIRKYMDSCKRENKEPSEWSKEHKKRLIKLLEATKEALEDATFKPITSIKDLGMPIPPMFGDKS
jgi:hypothetical protein